VKGCRRHETCLLNMFRVRTGYSIMLLNKTIAAISTPLAAGGIGIVRISGGNAILIADKMFKAKSKISLSEMKPYTAAYGAVYDGSDKLDECIALIFKAPRSYTGEDVAEISCHGGNYIMQKVLQVAIQCGAVLAMPGEFTKRAFLNGKMDLTEAEAVMDLINAKGKAAVNAALSQHDGALFKKIISIREKLIHISSDISAWVDFPEEDIPALEACVLKKNIMEAYSSINYYIENFEKGHIIREGAQTVIAGKPNTGKSTLMNLITGSESSIVTDIPGTTRDIIEDVVHMGELILKISDTAGFRYTDDEIEKIGVQKAILKLESADLVLAVFDGSQCLEQQDYEIIEIIKNKPCVAVINKTDLPFKIQTEIIDKMFDTKVYISATELKGIDELEKAIKTKLQIMDYDYSAGMIANQRQLECALNAKKALDYTIKAIDDGITLDAISVTLEEAISALLDLTGERASDEILNKVFERFCIGK
jgi:tRNA modification GTPase